MWLEKVMPCIKFFEFSIMMNKRSLHSLICCEGFFLFERYSEIIIPINYKVRKESFWLICAPLGLFFCSTKLDNVQQR